MGRQALTGWRRTVAQPVARGLARRTRLSVDQAQGLIGIVFFAASTLYVVKAIGAAVRSARR